MAGLKRLAEVERRVLERKAGRGLSGRPRIEVSRTNAPSIDGNQTDEGERIMFFRKFNVLKHERGLLFKDGDFIEFLEPGTYRYFGFKYAVERYDLSVAEFRHRLVDYMLETERDATNDDSSAPKLAASPRNDSLMPRHATMMSGSGINALAMETRCSSPPEN